jgi:phosphatidylinositol dimannoside acyltransferase
MSAVGGSSMERRGLNIRKGFLKAVLPVFRALPLPVASRFVSGIGRLEYRLSPSLRQSFDAAVAQGRTVLDGNWDTIAVSRELAGNHVLWRTRDLLLDGVPDERALEMFIVQGKEHLDVAMAENRGCIVLANHFGAHLLPAHWLFRANYPVRFYMERPRHISRYMARHFQTEGPLGQDKLFISRQGVPADSASSILRASRAIKAGLLLYLAGDVRWTGRLTETAQFLGRKMRFSTTWVVLAALTEAPVVMVFCRMEPDGRYHIEFRPAFHVPKDAVEQNQTGAWVRHFIEILEEQVRKHPTNSNEYFFWRELDDQVA